MITHSLCGHPSLFELGFSYLVSKQPWWVQFMRAPSGCELWAGIVASGVRSERQSLGLRFMVMLGFVGSVLLGDGNRGGKSGEFSAQDHPSTLTDIIFTEIKFSFFLAFMPITLPLVSNHDRCQCASSKASIFHSQGLEGEIEVLGASL